MIKYRLLGDQAQGTVSISGESIKLIPEHYKGRLTGMVKVEDSRRVFIESSDVFKRGNLIEVTENERGKELSSMAIEKSFENSPFTLTEYRTLFDLPKEAKELIKENAFMVRDRFLQEDGTTEEKTDDVPKTQFGVPLVEESIEGKYGQNVEDPDKGKFGGQEFTPIIVSPGIRVFKEAEQPKMTTNQMLDSIGQGVPPKTTPPKSSEIIRDVKNTTKPGKAILKKQKT